MTLTLISFMVLVLAAIPFVYYGIALYSAFCFFRHRPASQATGEFLPPISNLKPIRGLDPEAYENLATFCRQDYPAYEILFCLGGPEDPSLPVIQKLITDFPERKIRILFGTDRSATNDKAAKLARLVNEAEHEYVVISDSDVRVPPDYLRTVVAPMANPKVGAVTCFYVSTHETNLVQKLQSIGMMSDFYAGILVAWRLEGVKFALGPTIATSRTRLAAFGGYSAIENRPGDDLLVGRLIADQGYEVELLPYSISTVADYQGFRDLFHKRLRWIVVMRHMRPWGHLGLVFTHGLPWCLAAIAVAPSPFLAGIYLGTYLLLRTSMTWLIGTRGLKRHIPWKKLALIPLWDALAFTIWVISFGRKSVRWRDNNYYIRDGMLVPQVRAAQE
ncbi:MAG TPA: glycosyltransferase [Candidatus Angelobacter sp.]